MSFPSQSQWRRADDSGKNLNFYPFLVQKYFVSAIFDRKWMVALDRNQIGELITT